jgi:arabinofuranan 3-O-arabinosyltransferase
MKILKQSGEEGGGSLTAAERLTYTVAGGLGVGYAISFLFLCATHAVLFDRAGRPYPMDFTVFWTAGHLALQGHVLAAYSPALQHAAEVTVVGHPFSTVMGWYYPPLFLFVAVELARFTPSTGFVLWAGSTLLFQSFVVAAIARQRAAFFVATVPPWIMLGMLNGQNGLLTAAIIGAVLLTLERRPILSGILLGILSYKPQFALLFPLALAFGGYWRTFVWSCASAFALTLLSCAVFGFDTLPAFLHGLLVDSQSHLITNAAGTWPGLQSVFGLSRCLGASYGAAMLLQLLFSAFCAAFVALVWRGNSPYALKAAALASAVPLVIPYIFVYDLPVLSIAIAFLYRDREFDRIEWCGIAVALLSVTAFPFHTYPAGLAAGAAIGALVVRRIRRQESSAVAGPEEDVGMQPFSAHPSPVARLG